MNTYKSSATVATLMLMSQFVYAAPFGLEARSLAMGNVSVVTADIATAAFANPAMLSYQKSDDDFALLLPSIGFLIDDSDGMLDTIDAFQAADSAYDTATAAGDAAGALAAATDMFNEIVNLNGKLISPQLSGAAAIGVSGETYSFAVSARSDIILSGGVITTATSAVDVVTATNQLVLFGVQTKEVGVSIASNFDFLGRKIALGVTPKIINVTALAFTEALDTVGDGASDLIDDDLTVDLGDVTTLDAGIVVEVTENIQIGAVVRNLISDDLTVGTTTVKLDTQTRAGIAYRGDFFTLGADLDLTENDSITGIAAKSRMLSLGAEFNVFNTIQLRAGLQKNIASGISDNAKNELITAGVGIWLGFNLDISVISGDDVLGAYLQTGFRF